MYDSDQNTMRYTNQLTLKKGLATTIRSLIDAEKELLQTLEDGYKLKSTDHGMRKKYLYTIGLVEAGIKKEKKRLGECMKEYWDLHRSVEK